MCDSGRSSEPQKGVRSHPIPSDPIPSDPIRSHPIPSHPIPSTLAKPIKYVNFNFLPIESPRSSRGGRFDWLCDLPSLITVDQLERGKQLVLVTHPRGGFQANKTKHSGGLCREEERPPEQRISVTRGKRDGSDSRVDWSTSLVVFSADRLSIAFTLLIWPALSCFQAFSLATKTKKTVSCR